MQAISSGVTTASTKQYTINDLFDGPKVHDAVAKLHNHVLEEKGLSPNITVDIESLEAVDYINHVELIAEKDDEVSIAIKDMCKVLAVLYYDSLGFRRIV
eukprot:3001586-Ditylum_brightwellii.AAC.1